MAHVQGYISFRDGIGRLFLLIHAIGLGALSWFSEMMLPKMTHTWLLGVCCFLLRYELRVEDICFLEDQRG